MPKPQATIDAGNCHAEECEAGICVATLACPTKTLKQEAPYEIPFPVGLCKGCGICALICPFEAIRML
jgi:Pyruvate/2-oxoacid:ferredoxin oxidoreductase delta subunit